ncbi:hypothetical protein [Streptomyces arenae]|uniref:hypothetical protein n=1 Tax=Streptomyces arenae TaxID=29301 RepID=UPI00265B0DDD|nr:hypothetical protein [Streptomyces arenae]MCG7203940.1 hypothetical protein [Streptomyces arenae]
MPSEPASSTVDALALLELPALDGLTQGQVRGADCIWCGDQLSPETAVDLGERRHKRPGGRFSTFPRACPACVLDTAKDAFWTHPGSCEQCADDATICETSTGLRQLMRTYQR